MPSNNFLTHSAHTRRALASGWFWAYFIVAKWCWYCTCEFSRSRRGVATWGEGND